MDSQNKLNICTLSQMCFPNPKTEENPEAQDQDRRQGIVLKTGELWVGWAGAKTFA